MAIMMPALTKVRQQARLVICKNNQSQVLLGVFGYQSDWQDMPPTIQHIDYGSSQVPTIPNRVVYHSQGTGGIQGSNGGSLGRHLRHYLPDPIIYHCPLAPYQKVDTSDVYRDGGTLINSSYFYLWNYMKGASVRPVYRLDGQVLSRDFVGPGRKSNSKVVISDTLNWVNNSVHPFEWQSSHPFAGSSAMSHPYQSGPPHDTRLYFGQHILMDRTRTVPSVRLNVGYVDGSVSEQMSDNMVDVQFNAFNLVIPQWW